MPEHITYMSSYYGRNPLFPNSAIIVAKRDKNTDEISQWVSMGLKNRKQLKTISTENWGEF